MALTVSVTREAAWAAHRFGLGEADLSVVGPDPRGWLLAQIGPADPPADDSLAGTEEVLIWRAAARRRSADVGSPWAERAQARSAMRREPPGLLKERPWLAAQQDIVAQNLRARLLQATQSRRPWMERLALFWCNHFTVSEASGKLDGLAGAFEREAIRPHVAGRFRQLLGAAVRHPAMLHYLDNQKSVGPQSRFAQRHPKAGSGLNENLAREILELHTLGAESSRQPRSPAEGYTQADVTAFAQVLTGWTSGLEGDAGGGTRFDEARHQPGSKVILGRTYPEGEAALDLVLDDLARHPATARHLARRLAQHVLADEPPPALVDRLAQAFRRSDGDLPTLYRALVESPEAWQPQATKLRTPEEHALACARTLRLGPRWLEGARDGRIAQMGQSLQRAPSPAGWSDRAADWLGPEALWQRIEWTQWLVERFGAGSDARALAESGLGPLLGEGTRQQVARAADGPQALALLFLAPEFQRR